MGAIANSHLGAHNQKTKKKRLIPGNALSGTQQPLHMV